MIRVLLVDDQNLVRQGIKALVEQNPEIEVVGTFEDGRSALIAIEQLHPDVVLLDIEMPGMNGITATKHITRLAPETKVIILSSHEKRKYLTMALMAGAKSYLMKDSLTADLQQSIISAHNGYTKMESRLLTKVFHHSNIKQTKSNEAVSSRPKPISSDENSPRIPQKKAEVSTSSVKQVVYSPGTSNPTKLATMDVASAIARSESNEGTSTADSPHPAPSSTSRKEEADVKRGIEVFKPRQPSQRSIFPQERAPRAISNQGLTQLPDKKTLQATPTNTTFLSSRLAKFLARMRMQYPLFSQCQYKLNQYKYHLLSAAKRGYEKGWLANVSLALMGLIIVIIVHFIFF